MKSKDLRTLTLPELEQRLREAQEEQFKLKFQHKTGQLSNPLRIREVRKDIARLNSIIEEMKGDTTGGSDTKSTASGATAGEQPAAE